MVNRVAREKAVGCLRRKMKTGRPVSASSCESVSMGERKEEKLMMTNIESSELFSPDDKYLELHNLSHLKMSLILTKSSAGELPISLLGQ